MTQNTNIINNDFIVNKNDFIVYDIYEENNEKKYFFVCQNTGEERTMRSSFILDIYKDSFLMILNKQLKEDSDKRASLTEFNDLVWKMACKLLNVSNMLSEQYKDAVFNLDKELNTISKVDIHELKLDCYYNNDSFLIFMNSNNNLDMIKRDDFLSKIHNKALEIKDVYSYNNISKKMAELNKEALIDICLEEGIQYSGIVSEEDLCNHEYEFTKRHEPLEPSLEPDTFFYTFTCKHCGKTKNLLNHKIIDEVQKNAIQIISNQLSLPKRERMFNFRLSQMAINNFLEKEKIDTLFIQEYTKEYSLPNLNVELILVNPKDLTDSSLILSNTICKSSGLFFKEISKDVSFIITKDCDENILFTEKNN